MIQTIQDNSNTISSITYTSSTAKINTNNIITSDTHEFYDENGEFKYTVAVDEDFCHINYYEFENKKWNLITTLTVPSNFAFVIAQNIINDVNKINGVNPNPPQIIYRDGTPWWQYDIPTINDPITHTRQTIYSDQKTSDNVTFNYENNLGGKG